MWTKSHSKVYQGISKQSIWQLWADVNHYTEWHNDLDYCKLEGEFMVGNFFLLKPRDAPAVKVFITELIENIKFTDCTHFFGAKMYDIHELEDTSQGLRITNTLKVTGWLSFLWVKLVAKKVADSVPEEMNSLVKLARLKHD